MFLRLWVFSPFRTPVGIRLSDLAPFSAGLFFIRALHLGELPDMEAALWRWQSKTRRLVLAPSRFLCAGR